MRDYKTTEEQHRYHTETAIPFLHKLIKQTSDGFTYNQEGLDRVLSYREGTLFLETHHDIPMDHVCLSIPIGLSGGVIPWFVAGINLRNQLLKRIFEPNKVIYTHRNSKKSATYVEVNDVLRQHERVSMAEQDGRAKDGQRYTDPGIIGFACRTDRMTPKDFTDTYAVVPVANSFEWIPDAKIMAAQQLRKKRKIDDTFSTFNGFLRHKGRIHVHYGARIQGDFNCARDVAAEIDGENTRNYALWPASFMAAVQLRASRCLQTEILDTMTDEEAERGRRYIRRVSEMDEKLQPHVHALHAGKLASDYRLEEAVAALVENKGRFPVFLT